MSACELGWGMGCLSRRKNFSSTLFIILVVEVPVDRDNGSPINSASSPCAEDGLKAAFLIEPIGQKQIWNFSLWFEHACII